MAGAAAGPRPIAARSPRLATTGSGRCGCSTARQCTGGTGAAPPWFPLSCGIMTPSSRCPICQGETFEIRAKLVCRQCGTILETCCEGGPMGRASGGCDGGAARGDRVNGGDDDDNGGAATGEQAAGPS